MRKNFESGIVTPQPVFIIGTYDENSKPNAMNAAWAGQVGPKQISISLSAHKSTENLKNQKEFTLSFATKAQVIASDYVGIASANKVEDKMEKTGWTIQKAEHVNAPYFEELPVTLECKVLSAETEFNETRIVGEIINMSADESVLTDGKVDLAKLQPIMFDCSSMVYREIGAEVGGAWRSGKELM